MPLSRRLAWIAVATAMAAGGVQAAPPAAISSGQRVAQRSCGGCHAVAAGKSPLADAPPFRDLYRRYPAGGLDALLAEGMLAPARPPEEGGRPSHPRMPTAALDVDQVADLTAYLHGLEPKP